MKIDTWKGCRDCPHLRSGGFAAGWACRKFSGIYGRGGMDTPPETAHPDCKLVDVPTADEIKAVITVHTERSENAGIPFEARDIIWFNKGIQFILHKLKR